MMRQIAVAREKHRILRTGHLIALISFVCATLLATPLCAAIRTWSGASSSYLWSDSANWIGSVAPNTGDDLVFPTGGPLKNAINDFPAATAFNSITLNERFMALQGNEVRLGGGGVTSTLF